MLPLISTLALTYSPIYSPPLSLRRRNSPPIMSAKSTLLSAIETYNAATASDGVPSVDFGVSGGELDGDSRAPRDLLKAGAYYAVSDTVGKAADAVVEAIDSMEAANPTEVQGGMHRGDAMQDQVRGPGKAQSAPCYTSPSAPTV